jgi:hypothetical protein
MDRIPLLGLGEQPAHRSLRGLGRVRRADRLPERRHGIGPLEDHRHAWPRGHERGERLEERPLPMDIVECLGLSLREVNHPRGDDPEAIALQMRQDLSGAGCPERVGLDDRQCAFASHFRTL